MGLPPIPLGITENRVHSEGKTIIRPLVRPLLLIMCLVRYIIGGIRFLCGDEPPGSRGNFQAPTHQEQKMKGRSPVPSAGAIIEPHTDKFPDYIHLLSASYLQVATAYSRISSTPGV